MPNAALARLAVDDALTPDEIAAMLSQLPTQPVL
jgi:two-component system chemotaxis response regulator CheB